MKRILSGFALCVLNWLICGIFMIVRPEATALVEEKERAEQSGFLSLCTCDPYMLIAARPLWQWNQWRRRGRMGEGL